MTEIVQPLAKQRVQEMPLNKYIYTVLYIKQKMLFYHLVLQTIKLKKWHLFKKMCTTYQPQTTDGWIQTCVICKEQRVVIIPGG